MPLLRSTLNTRPLKVTLALVVAQQLLVAAGTFLLAKLAIQAQTQMPSVAMGLALLVCVSLPGTLGHYGISRFTVLAVKEALRSYYLLYVIANFGHAAQWRDPDAKRDRHEVLCKTGPDAVQAATIFTVDAAATTLNILFNTISVMLVSSGVMGIAIAAAAALGLLLVHLADPRIIETARSEMLAESALTAQLQRSWDNVVLGNRPFFERWRQRFEAQFLAARRSAIASTHAREGAVALAGFLTNFVVVGTALTVAWLNRAQPAVMVGLIVTLPRSLQIVMHMQVIQSYWAQWKSLREKVAIAEVGLSAPSPSPLEQYIRSDEISLESGGVRANFTSGKRLLNMRNGRVTITGTNGAGKSTSLLAIKAELGERAIYLPAHHQLELAEDAILSSGQSALSALRCARDSSSDVLLLDEWDANLSPENRARQNALIDELARDRLVVEVRHAQAAT